jgi:hypothetical protein
MSATGPERGARFTAVMAAIAARLPLGLNRVVSARLLGFAAISSLTFTVDLGGGHVVGEPHAPHTLILTSPGSRIGNSV